MLLGVVVLVATSCEETIDLGIEEEETRLVVSCNFEPDTVFEVLVSSSRSALAIDELTFFDNAVVRIFEGEDLIENLSSTFDFEIDAPIFRSDFRPQEGIPYRIEVEALGLEPVSATDIIPPKVPLQTFEISNIRPQFIGNTSFVQYVMDVRVVFEDPPEEVNFYHLNFFFEETQTFIDGTDTFRLNLGRSPLILENTPNDQPFILHHKKGVLIDDQITNTQRLEYRFEATTTAVQIDESPQNIFVELRNTTSSYYHYHNSLTQQSKQRDLPLAAPVILFNNITGGYGIFAGYNTTILSAQLQ